jgi:hypothetical protein
VEMTREADIFLNVIYRICVFERKI